MNRKTAIFYAIKSLFLVVIVGGFVTLFSFGEIKGVTNLTTAEAAKLMDESKDRADFTIIDVRTIGEYTVSHLTGAINIDFRGANFENEVAKLDRNKTFLVYCRTGNRSGKSLPVFEKLGFTKIYHLAKGITDWTSAGRPVVTPVPK